MPPTALPDFFNNLVAVPEIFAVGETQWIFDYLGLIIQYHRTGSYPVSAFAAFNSAVRVLKTAISAFHHLPRINFKIKQLEIIINK